MWFGITYLPGDEDHEVIVSVWDDARPLRIGGSARSVADIVCSLREAGGTQTSLPRCDRCGTGLDVPDLDAEARAAA